MDFTARKFLINQKETVHEGTVEQMVESDITLPDYCPDISKILKCKIDPQIYSTNIAGDRVTIEGKAQIRLIYADENNSIRSHEQTYSFSKYFEDASVSENITAVIKSKVEYVNCRAISARKADVRANIVFVFKLLRKTTHEVVSECEGAEIQLRKDVCHSVDFCSITEKDFSVGEILQLPSDLPSVGQIIRESSVIIPGEVKVINNKVLFKAELNVTVLYTDSSDVLYTYKDTIPLTQVMETDINNEKAWADLVLNISSFEVQLKSDANSEMRLFDVNSRVNAVAELYCENEFNGVTDAYSTRYNLEMKKNSVKLRKKIDSINESALYKSELDFSTSGITKVVDMWVSNIKSKAEVKENQLVFNNKATVCIIYQDRDSALSYAEREIEFDYKKSTGNYIDVFETPDVKISEIRGVVLGDTTCEFKMEYYIRGEIFASEMKYLVTEIIPDESNIKTKDNSAVTLYFADANENVWDIARKYNSSVERIMTENSLDEETVSEKCMLMITSD